MKHVIDASMALSFVLADEFTDRSQRVLDAMHEHGAVAPPLWNYEVLNGLRSAEHRGRLSPAAVAAGRAVSRRFRLTSSPTDPTGCG